MKKLFMLCLLGLSIFMFSSCGSEEENIMIDNQEISHETKFGGVYIHKTIDEFNELGFSYGDSIEISFTNGYKLENLPYYNGYYTNAGDPLLVGYKGYPYIRVGINNGEDLFILAKLSENDKATIKLVEKGKYKDIQDALNLQYSDIQGDTPDYIFGNFRVCNVGNLKENILFRSASPVDNQHNRAHVVDKLLGANDYTIINLSDSLEELINHFEAPDFESPNTKRCYDEGRVIALDMDMNFKASLEANQLFSDYVSTGFTNKLVEGLRFMINRGAPYLVHCVEGKDRTGFVIMVLEAIAGATYDEIITDYMTTYFNYYGINEENDKVKYEIIKEKNIDEMLRTIIDDENQDIKNADYKKEIAEYLISKGLTEGELETLTSILEGKM